MSRRYKPVEFRGRASRFRGNCYIHASRTFDQSGYDWLMQHPDLPGVEELKKLHFRYNPKTLAG
ncbi:MAG: hypothetical protein PHU03_03085, partial [Syntrophales bacterium]|nr:hypothetical protein [Syntrophales bacterium]